MNWLVQENSSTKVASVFLTQAAAHEAAMSVMNSAGLSESQVNILGPADAQRSRLDAFGEKVQPESRGILRTFVRSHLVLGAVGGLLGVIVWWALMSHPLVASTPLMALVALAGFGVTFGMLGAGLVTLRPDQSILFVELRELRGVLLEIALRSRLRAGQWGVIFHPIDAAQTEAVRNALRVRSAEVHTTL